MRWMLSGVLMFGLLLILWGVTDARQDGMGTNLPKFTPNEDGTGWPPPDPPEPKR